MIGRNDPCWCGSGKKWKKCHYPDEGTGNTDDLAKEMKKRYGVILKTPEQIEGIRAAGHLAAKILDATCTMAKPGVSTKELNDFALQLHQDAGAVPAPLGYGDPPFPACICTSINDVICHGIPSADEILQEGDILNIDVTPILNGYYGDNSKMVVVGGKTTPDRQRVVDTSYGCLMAAIDVVRPGAVISDIGNAIQKHADANNCSVVYQFVAHGVGVDFHEAPQIAHQRNRSQVPIVPGMTFTIEPMINLGVADGEIDEEDAWTARTLDGLESAQWEHMLLVTGEGVEILTPWTK